MPSNNKRHLLFSAITLVLMLLLLEGLCYVAYRVNPLSAVGWQYYDTAFGDLKPARGALGWDAYGASPRPSNGTYQSQCVTAFGDSFTHGDEVTHDESWSQQASELLGCEVVNHGVGGYGTDQAYVRYSLTGPQTPVVLLGVYQEMLRRNLAASWLFYGTQQAATLKPYFTLDSGGLQQVPMPTNPSVDDLKAYHAADRYYQATRIGPPYSLALMRAVYHRLSTTALNRARILPPETAYSDPQSRALQLALVDRLRDDAQRQGQRLAMLFFPTAEQALEGIYPYASLLRAIAVAHPEDCLIDPGPALHAASRAQGRALAAPKGHFDATGNRVIAETVAASLLDCGFVTAAAPSAAGLDARAARPRPH